MSDARPQLAPADGAAHGTHPALAHHFDTLEQQAEAATLGMWVFLVTEILFFGGAFMAYAVYRIWHHDAFGEASHHLDVTLGTINTLVLICSSLTMALAVRAGQTSSRPRTQVSWLGGTLLLGVVFLVIKGFEYAEKFHEGHVPGANFVWEGPTRAGAELFFALYFAMTGLHALHMIIGAGIMTVMMIMAARGAFDSDYYAPLEVSGLYWHFVDIVWIFLFPLLYLIGRH
jgi:cytochrome c oxidase subunit 3